MQFNTLLIEDNPQKKAKIIEYMYTLKNINLLDTATSYISGCKLLESNNSLYDLILLDISLPTYDKNSLLPSGKFRSFGGREIARKIVRRKYQSKIIFITQYTSFIDESKSYNFQELKEELKKECKDNYLGMIQFDSTKENWKIELSKLIGKLS